LNKFSVSIEPVPKIFMFDFYNNPEPGRRATGLESLRCGVFGARGVLSSSEVLKRLVSLKSDSLKIFLFNFYTVLN
jgi:hypothetical protein